jgi:hypothetical protein
MVTQFYTAASFLFVKKNLHGSETIKASESLKKDVLLAWFYILSSVFQIITIKT